MSLPLFTSLPPQLRGTALYPPAPQALQNLLADTWHQAGFSPVSINTAAEHQRHPNLLPGITALGVAALTTDPAAAPPSRRPPPRPHPLCTMAEFLDAIHAHSPTGPVAIVNADIGLTPAAHQHALQTAARATQCSIGQRLDVAALPELSEPDGGTTDLHGFDFLSFPSEIIPSLRSLLPKVLRFGMPWWDHYLPLSLLMLGLRPRLAPHRSLWHLSHHDRWCMKSYTQTGLMAARQFAAALRLQPPSSTARAWLRLFEERFGAAEIKNRRDRLMRRLIDTSLAPPSAIRNRLGILAGGSVALLLQAAAAAPPPPRPNTA